VSSRLHSIVAERHTIPKKLFLDILLNSDVLEVQDLRFNTVDYIVSLDFQHAVRKDLFTIEIPIQGYPTRRPEISE